MHEYAVVDQLVRIGVRKAEENRAIRVNRINVVAGELTGYAEESLQEYFRLLSQGTILENALLSVRYTKPRMRCERCGREYERERFSFDCPYCGGPGVMTGGGTEFFIEDMEIEVE